MEYMLGEAGADVSLEADVPAVPRRIFLELTSRCTMNCRFCPSPVLQRPHQDMPRELVEKVLTELRQWHSLSLSLSLPAYLLLPFTFWANRC